jgi:hypothetical protein
MLVVPLYMYFTRRVNFIDRTFMCDSGVICARDPPHALDYRGTSLIRNHPSLGSYSRPQRRALGDPRGAGVSCERGSPLQGLLEITNTDRP